MTYCKLDNFAFLYDNEQKEKFTDDTLVSFINLLSHLHTCTPAILEFDHSMWVESVAMFLSSLKWR